MCFPSRQPSHSGTQWKCWTHASHFITQNVRRCIFKGWDSITLIIFTTSLRPPSSHGWQWRMQWPWYSLESLPRFLLRCQLSYPSLLLHHQCKCQQQKNWCLIQTIVSTLRTLLRTAVLTNTSHGHVYSQTVAAHDKAFLQYSATNQSPFVQMFWRFTQKLRFFRILLMNFPQKHDEKKKNKKKDDQKQTLLI